MEMKVLSQYPLPSVSPDFTVFIQRNMLTLSSQKSGPRYAVIDLKLEGGASLDISQVSVSVV